MAPLGWSSWGTTQYRRFSSKREGRCKLIIKTELEALGIDAVTGKDVGLVRVDSIVEVLQDDQGFIVLRETGMGRFRIHPDAQNVIRIEIVPPPKVATRGGLREGE